MHSECLRCLILFLIVMVVLHTAWGLEVISRKVVECSTSEFCKRKVLYTLRASYTGQRAWTEPSLTIQPSEVLLDSNSRQWGISTPDSSAVRLDISFANVAAVFGIFRKYANVSNAYERKTVFVNPLCYYPGKECCVDPVDSTIFYLHSIERNSTVSYDVFGVAMLNLAESVASQFQLDAGSPALTMDLRAQVTSTFLPTAGSTADYSYQRTVRGANMTRTVVDNSATRQYLAVSEPFVTIPLSFSTSLASRSLLVERQNTETTMVVPSSIISTNVIRSFGVSDATFHNSFQCDRPLNFWTYTNNADKWDQLQPYRSNTVNAATGCSMARDISYFPSPLTTNNTGVFAVAFDCTSNSWDVFFSVSLHDSAINIVKKHGTPVITDKGMFRVTSVELESTGNTLIGIYVDITNKDTTTGTFGILPASCCMQLANGTTDCNSIHLYDTGSRPFSSFETARFLFSVDFASVMNIQTTCRFHLYQHAVVEDDVLVVFNASLDGVVKIPRTQEFLEQVTKSNPCNAPKKVVTIEGIQYCQRPCTNDEIHDEALKICVPVGCKQRYGSLRPFWNSTAKQCVAFKECPAYLSLNEEANMCVGELSYDPSTESAGTSSDGDNPTPDIIDLESIMRTINITCVHGAMGKTSNASNAQRVCVCDSGWTSKPWTYAELYINHSYIACSVRDVSNSETSFGSTKTSSSDWSSNDIMLTCIVGIVVLFAVVIVWLALEKLVCCCFRDKKSHKETRQKRMRRYERRVMPLRKKTRYDTDDDLSEHDGEQQQPSLDRKDQHSDVESVSASTKKAVSTREPLKKPRISKTGSKHQQHKYSGNDVDQRNDDDDHDGDGDETDNAPDSTKVSRSSDKN
eukprot:ANDGO_03688.mRNA.1 hypothetical protein ACA1_048430